MDITNELSSILMRNFDEINLECKVLEQVIGMDSDEIVKGIEEIKLIECGAYVEKVAEKWTNFNKTSVPTKEKKLFAGLNNNDNSYIAICLLEKDPTSVFEGMAITGIATGISKGILYIPKEKEVLKKELEDKISKIDLRGFDIEIVIGKIDIREVNESVLFHHIETLASIAAYFNLGEDFKQTRIVSVIGDVKKEGIGEINIKSNIKSIIEEISGGANSDVKAIIVGGISGKCITESDAEEAYFIGNGNSEIIVLNNEDCIVNIAMKSMLDLNDNTCGKCTFCREGSHQLRQMLVDATEGKGKVEDIEIMEELSRQISEETLCSLGQKGVEFLETSLELFKSEYEAHIKRKKCLTGTCQAFLSVAIMGDKCDGCGECMEVCDFSAIEGKKGYIHMIDEFECTKCGKCIEVCPMDAIVKVPANKTVGPAKLTKVGRWKKRR